MVTGSITVTPNNDTDVAFKKSAPFSSCKAVINVVFVDEANHIYITMPMSNLNEYSLNYLDTSGSLWQFKRDEAPANNVDLSIDNSESFKYKAAIVGKTKDFANQKSSVKDTKIVVPLKYLSNFWRSLEMSLINCKVHLELKTVSSLLMEILQNLRLQMLNCTFL